MGNEYSVGNLKSPDFWNNGIVQKKLLQDASTIGGVLGWVAGETPGNGNGCVQDERHLKPVSFMQKLAGNEFAEVQVIFITKFEHLAHGNFA